MIFGVTYPMFQLKQKRSSVECKRLLLKPCPHAYRNSSVLSNFRLDHRRIVNSLECPCRHPFFRQGGSIISGPTVRIADKNIQHSDSENVVYMLENDDDDVMQRTTWHSNTQEHVQRSK